METYQSLFTNIVNYGIGRRLDTGKCETALSKIERRGGSSTQVADDLRKEESLYFLTPKDSNDFLQTDVEVVWCGKVDGQRSRKKS
ncbi:hypothetical protein EVAR_72066_1 [Eumeta japonica]|uniref:Uncharacterized protein n=1 Tax=Eumeta variegata TaxID=151549 RepID=A0A4C2A9I6_EUMVA|nr:hypothetical protein EVAR_72066_1 [Eumeta japonica]